MTMGSDFANTVSYPALLRAQRRLDFCVRGGDTSRRAPHLWDSYNVAIAPISKTYVRDGTWPRSKRAAFTGSRFTTHRNIPCWTLSCWRSASASSRRG